MTWVSGLPPRMRGKMVDLSLQTLDLRITPAYARKSRTSAPALPGYRDHPRMRGENVLATSCRLRVLGSPPHARGKYILSIHAISNGGITPACAGKIETAGAPPGPPGDHPRMRGENIKDGFVKPADAGSPPHARGKSTLSAQRHNGNGDHPRMRGENELEKSERGGNGGSPPHARGK